MITLERTIPALPARDVGTAVGYYRDRLGFEVAHHDGGFAVLRRGDATLHLWEAGDESWRERDSLASKPVCSGAESFIAGTASCRVETHGIDELYAELRETAILHGVSHVGVSGTDFGAREFHTLDEDGNLITIFEWVAA